MKAFAENLALLFLSPRLWPWYLGSVLITLFSLRPLVRSPASGTYALHPVLLFPAWTAFFTAALQKEVSAKPFAFCLPGRPALARGVIFAAGTCAALLAGLAAPALAGPALSRGAAVLSLACFSFLLFSAVAAAMFHRNDLSPVFFIALICLYFVPESFPAAERWIREAALLHPARNAALAALAAGLLWRDLHGRALHRKLCGRPLIPLGDPWNEEKRKAVLQRRFAEQNRKKRKKRRVTGEPTRAERRALSAMERHPPLTPGRYIAGCLYGFRVQLAEFPLLVKGLVFLGWFAGCADTLYASPGKDGVSFTSFLFFLSCIAAIVPLDRIPAFSLPLLPAGRRERFWGTLAWFLYRTLIVLWLVASAILILWVLDRTAPHLRFLGRDYVAHPPAYRLAYVPFAILPILYSVQLVFRKKPLPALLAVFLLCLMLYTALASHLARWTFTEAAALLLVCWGCFALAARRICLRADLVR